MSSVRRFLFVGFLGLAVAGCGYFANRTPHASAPVATTKPVIQIAKGRPAPEIIGQDVDGKPLHLSDYKGKVVLLDFWATW